MAGLHKVNTPHDEDRDAGTLILVVRQDDAVTELDGEDGDFRPLSVDAQGHLRVSVPATGIRVERTSTVESLLEETNSLLRRLVLAMEMIHGTPIEDPQ